MAEILDKQTIKALSADARQQMMKLLANRPYTASEISKLTGKHVTTIGQHLNVLEKASLVCKKPNHKWIYYELTEKGERLFKPKFYSWVIVFSLSIVLMFVGTLRLFRFETMFDTYTAKESAPLLAQGAMAADVVQVDYVSYGLIILGAIGLIYLAYRNLKA